MGTEDSCKETEDTKTIIVTVATNRVSKITNENKELLNDFSYYILVSNLWQRTNKEAYDYANHNNGLPTIRINNEYFDEVFEVIHDTSMCLEDRLKYANEIQGEMI